MSKMWAVVVSYVTPGLSVFRDDGPMDGQLTTGELR